MKYRPRIYYTASQRALMWEHWKQGWTLHEIAKLKKLLAEAHLDMHALKSFLGVKR